MNATKIDGLLFKQILEYGYKNLSIHFQAINDLNVFPVPDGDTGTNMKMTFNSGLNAIEDNKNIGEVADKFARGMLFGARGNSGVLSSQYFSGLSKGLIGKEEATVSDFAKAMVSAYETAYAATVDPTEGTILTVAREGIENIKNNINENTTYTDLLGMVVDSMKVSLDNTPNLLPVLKDAGVIDSGGKGLLTIFEGFFKFFTGEELNTDDELEGHSSKTTTIDYSLFNENSTLDYGYCTEFLLQLLVSKIDINSFNLQDFISFLNDHGNSIVCFQNGTIVKVHIHTKKPYEVIEFAQRFGEFVTFKMENMALQHNEVVAKKEEKKKTRKKYAIVSIAQGDGIIDIFKETGSDIVLNSGQTMNTSSAEMIDAFKEANADSIIVLPSNGNIIMAAKQAAELYKDSKVYVLETKSIPATYNALNMIIGGEESVEECYQSMLEANETLTTGFICKSIRNSEVDGVHSVKGDYIEGVNGHLVGDNKDRTEAVLDMLSKVEDLDQKSVLFGFYGQMMTKEEVEKLTAAINEKYPDLEVWLFDGKQDLYDLLIGIN